MTLITVLFPLTRALIYVEGVGYQTNAKPATESAFPVTVTPPNFLQEK